MAQPAYTRIIDLRPSLLPVNVNFIVLDKGKCTYLLLLTCLLTACKVMPSAPLVEHPALMACRRGEEQGR